MVNKRHEDEHQDDIEVTTIDIESPDPDLIDLEARDKDVISSLREKLKHCDSEKREILEEMQRTKADFLNARRRLEEERLRDRERSKIYQVEELIPLCDSFQMAMSDRELWEKADENWRKGIESIYSQLEKLLAKYQVELINPLGEKFNPHQHEALSTTKVKEEKEHDKIISVIQNGYQITHLNGTTELIRPARVLIGVYEDK